MKIFYLNNFFFNSPNIFGIGSMSAPVQFSHFNNDFPQGSFIKPSLEPTFINFKNLLVN